MVAKIPTIYMQLLQPCAGPFFDQQVFMNILLSRFKVSSVRIVMLIVINWVDQILYILLYIAEILFIQIWLTVNNLW